MDLVFVKASELVGSEPKCNKIVEQEQKAPLFIDEVALLEDNFVYSAIMYESDLLRFRFDFTQFEAFVPYEIKFIDLLPLYNEWYYRYNTEFLELRNRVFTVVKIIGPEHLFLLFLTNNERDYKKLLDLSRMKSFKRKAIFTTSERSLLSKIKNGGETEHIKNGLYWETLQDDIASTLSDIQKKEDMKAIYSQYWDNIRGRDITIQDKLTDCLNYLNDDLRDLEDKLQDLKNSEDNLLFQDLEKESDYWEEKDTNIPYNEYKSLDDIQIKEPISPRVKRALEKLPY